MDTQAIARLALKREEQLLLQDLGHYRLSPIEAKAVVHRLQAYLAEKEAGLMDGQVYYSAVVFGEPAGRPLAQCRMLRVCLTLDHPSDLQFLQPGGKGVQALREARLSRLALEAVAQGARLTQEDFVRLLGVDVRTVRRMIQHFRQHGVFIPTRGYSQDIGRGTSHKAVAIKLFLQYATYSDIARQTNDSVGCLKRYLQDFSAVVQALTLGIPEHHIPAVTGQSPRLVEEYVALYREYNTPEHQAILTRLSQPLTPQTHAEKGGL